VIDREQVISDVMATTGRTREQAEALLAITGSGMRRRGLADGEPLSPEELDAHVATWLGDDQEVDRP